MRLCAVLFPFTILVWVAWAGPPLIHHSFDETSEGWMAYGSASAKVQVTHEPASVKAGKGALELDYQASASEPALLLLRVPALSLQSMKTIRFWAMSESSMAAAVNLREKTGGRYLAMFWLEPHAWQRIELTPEDFILAQNENDPPDPDGKLDLDQVQTVAILDISQFLNATMSEGSSVAVVAHEGAQKLWIDEFEVSDESPAWFHGRAHWLIDDFAHPQLNWLTMGGADLQRDVSRKIIAGNALLSNYQQIDERFAVILHPLPRIDLTGATHIAFDIASNKDVNLVISLTEQVQGKMDGPHYNSLIEVKGGGKAAHRQLALSSFELDTNGPTDRDGKLDLDKLKSFGILDVSSAFTGETGVNTIRIGNIQAIKVQVQAQE